MKCFFSSVYTEIEWKMKKGEKQLMERNHTTAQTFAKNMRNEIETNWFWSNFFFSFFFGNVGLVFIWKSSWSHNMSFVKWKLIRSNQSIAIFVI